jgi:hypothetical protein
MGFAGVSGEGQSFLIDGIDVWKHEWVTVSGEAATVTDPLYGQTFRFHVYEINAEGRTIRFAAGEFSNSVFGFYTARSL